MDSEGRMMQTEAHLPETDWQMVSKVYDLLTSTPDLRKGVLSVLEFILASFQYQSAALYHPGLREIFPTDWTFIQVPYTEQQALQSQASPFARYVEQAARSGSVSPGAADLNLAGVFPLSISGSQAAVLLVFGPTIPLQSFASWQILLQPVVRILAIRLQPDHQLPGSPSQSELINSRNTLRALFDSLPISIYIIDSTYQLIAVNNSRAARVGEPPKTLVGEICYEKFFRRSSPCPFCQVALTLRTGQITSRLQRDWLEYDTFIEWEINTFPIQAETELPSQIIVVEADVTEKRNLEANLIQSEKLAAVGQLAAGVAHEINNPLTAIIANVQLLRRDLAPHETDLLESANLIETASTRAHQVVQNLLGVARKERAQFGPVDINESLQNALSLVQHEMMGRPIQIQLNLAEQMPPLTGSQDQLQGVWINLLLNAIDAIDKNNGLIVITSRYTGAGFEVVIQDNGKGIQPEYISRVFEPFYTTKIIGRGTGLGLSVCLRVVRQHNGNIVVESEPGSWTRFTVTMPQTKLLDEDQQSALD